ncbi:HIT domain-containing protein [Candidatus Pacearchaeota archaeon]|nr:HIT domain-containing protein [Candidatus Pacearchaeota archaeon]
MDEECIFCKIASKKIQTKFIGESENFISFPDKNPKSKGHALVVSKRHYQTALDMPDELYSEMFSIAKKIMAYNIKNNKATGFNLVINNFKSAGQVINHVHLHVIPRYNGKKINVLDI